MVNLEDGPERLDFSFAFVRLILRFFHLDRQFLKTIDLLEFGRFKIDQRTLIH